MENLTGSLEIQFKLIFYLISHRVLQIYCFHVYIYIINKFYT